MSATNLSSTSRIDRLSATIDSMQSNLRRKSKSASLVELSKCLADAIHAELPNATIALFHQGPQSNSWNVLVGDASTELNLLQSLPKTIDVFHHDDHCTIISHRIADQSILAIAVYHTDVSVLVGENEILSLRLLLQVFDGLFQETLTRQSEKNQAFSLNHRILQLNSVIETGIEVSKLDQTELPHRLALTRAVSLTNASQGSVRISTSRGVRQTYTFPGGEIQRRANNEEHYLFSEFTFQEEKYTFELFDKESRKGIVSFEETDKLILDALARQVYASLENRYLLLQSLEKQRIEQDMAVAAAIQQKILPNALPSIAGYDLFGINIPSKSVGGDYYDCLRLSDGKYLLVVADVAGKGVPAALLVSSFHAYLQAYIEASYPLAELVARMNKVLYRDSTSDKFITAFFALLSPDSGEIEYVSAGHNPAFIHRRDNSIVELALGGVPLAVVDFGIPYISEKVVLGGGDRLFLYTDGVSEAENTEHQLFENFIALADYLQTHKSSESKQFVMDLLSDVRAFAGDAPQSDDITTMYLMRL